MGNLAIFIDQKVESREWLRVKISRHASALSHLLFTNDCLLFVLANDVLKKFCTTLSLKMHLDKSRVMARLYFLVEAS